MIRSLERMTGCQAYKGYTVEWTVQGRGAKTAGWTLARERALQEWNLLDQESFITAGGALCKHLDPGSRVLASQVFRHTRQGEVETVADSRANYKITR